MDLPLALFFVANLLFIQAMPMKMLLALLASDIIIIIIKFIGWWP